MVSQLDYDEERVSYEQARTEFDRLLQVEAWGSPLQPAPTVPAVSEGPWWWRGDEDASQSFLREMGVE